MTLYFFVAWAGAIATATLLWPCGLAVAIACAPLGGSLAAFLVAAYAAYAEPGPSDVDADAVETRRHRIPSRG